MTVLDFMHLVGDSRLSQMLSKESVSARLASPQGINYAEFSYQLFQAYDFWFLHRNEGCNLQIGGSDQWGNICAGIEVVRKRLLQESQVSSNGVRENVEEENEKEAKVYGLTIPLMTTANGDKFGKSAGNAIWLDPKKLSPYEFYQFFRRSTDAEVERYLLAFTFVEPEAVADVVLADSQAAQKLLAFEVTELVHGYAAARSVLVKIKILFEDGMEVLNVEEIKHALTEDEHYIELKTEDVHGASLVSLLIASGVSETKSGANKAIKAGGINMNGVRVEDGRSLITDSNLIHGSLIILRQGKVNYKIVSLV